MLLNFKEACEHLNVTDSWLRSAIFKKKIIYIKMGRLIRFKLSDLDLWIEKNKQGGQE